MPREATAEIPLPDSWQVQRLAGALGAEVRGPSLARLGDAEFAAVRALLLEHLVLFFPDQHLEIDEHVAFGRRFGPLEAHPNLKNPFTEHPELFELAATHGGVADEWHTDLTFRPDPAVLSVLQFRKAPTVGRDTQWASLYAAYDELSAPLRELCEGTNPRFTVRYRWSEGTVAIWDNRCTQHFVLNDFEGKRIIHRVTVMGDRPEGVGPPRWQPWGRPGRRSATSRHDRQLARFLREQRT